MDEAAVKDVLLVLLPFATALISAAATFYFTNRRDILLQIRQERVRRYESLITSLKNGFLNSSLSDSAKTTAKHEYYAHSDVVWLYASDDVIRRLNDFARAFSEFDRLRSAEADRAAHYALEHLIHAMRVDTRGNTELRPDEFVGTSVS